MNLTAMANQEYHKRLQDEKTVEMLPGIFRTTLAHNSQLMLCHFQMKKGAHIPLHSHAAAQIGYVIKGKVRFFTKDGAEIIAESGSSYVFASNEEHGSDVLEDAELIECFTPMRPEYIV